MRWKYFVLLAVCVLTARNIFAFQDIDFEGFYDLETKQLQVDILPSPDQTAAPEIDLPTEPVEPMIKIVSIRKADSLHEIQLDVNHFGFRKFDFSGDFTILVDLNPSDQKTDISLDGKQLRMVLDMTSGYSLLDFKPTGQLSGDAQLIDGTVYFTLLSSGKMTVKGSIDTKAPHALNIQCDLFSINLDNFLKFWMKEKSFEALGDVTGVISVSGNFKKPYLKGVLNSYNGKIKELKFDNIRLVGEGAYPQIVIAQSSVTQSDGVSYALDGQIDLSDRENFKRQIEELRVSPVVSDSIHQREWTIKRKTDEDSATSVELKYLLRQGDDLKPGDETSDMLGVEHKLEF